MITIALIAIIGAVLFSIVRIAIHHKKHRHDVHPGDIMNDNHQDWNNYRD